MLRLSSKILFVAAAFFVVVSCSKEDDEPTPELSLEEVELSLLKKAKPVSMPRAMEQSSDPYAKAALTNVEQVNKIADLFSNLQPPAGATKSKTPITGNTGGRVEEEVLSYIWTDGNTTIGYQITDKTDKYVFEVFCKAGEGEFIKYIYAEEFKEEKKGNLQVFNPIGGTGNEDWLLKYSWEEAEDGTFKMDLNTANDAFAINIQINPDQSGSVKYYDNKELFQSITWDKDGNGTWEIYQDGQVIQSGSWTA